MGRPRRPVRSNSSNSSRHARGDSRQLRSHRGPSNIARPSVFCSPLFGHHLMGMRQTIASIMLTLFCPALASAQGDRASIVGVVQDASGAVLLGVTVEASGPALIEQSRSVLSDGNGRYAIENLQ